ncbi:MAG: sigma-70 family RNA polymerase sigma factor [Deltaproteobacteria bacterium]|nr:sigma-70 family RNA polymerase sigma factor [Deltaproteobacteria bacterium]
MTSARKPEDPPAADEGVRKARAVLEAAKARTRSAGDARARDRARDQQLVDAARGGDGRAFRALVEAHQARLFAVAFGMLRDRDDAMDAVQDAFIKAHKKLAEFEGNAAFSTWLYRICVNLCIDRKRADARRRKVDLDDALATHKPEDALYGESEIGGRLSGENPLRTLSDKQLGAEIGRAMGELSEDHRAILLLREVEGMSYEEIAEALEIPRGTVMSRLFHARRNLQRLLRPYLGVAEGASPFGPGDPDAGDPEQSAPKGRP